MTKIRKSTRYFVHALNYVRHLNTPIRFFGSKWYVNERIVEIPFVHQALDINSVPGMEILELGCTRSTLSLELCSLGAKVTGIDLRPFFVEHPNFTFKQGDLLDLNINKKFDVILSVSTVEHIGLGAYGESENFDNLHEVTTKLGNMVKKGGKIMITVPVGKESQDDFLRSFTYEQVQKLFKSKSLKLTEEYFYARKQFKYWEPVTKKQIEKVSNTIKDRGPSGVNGVGCFVWTKS